MADLETTIRMRGDCMRIASIFPSNGNSIRFRFGKNGPETVVYYMPLDQMHMLVSSMPLTDDFYVFSKHNPGFDTSRTAALAEINRCIERENEPDEDEDGQDSAHAPTPLTAA